MEKWRAFKIEIWRLSTCKRNGLHLETLDTRWITLEIRALACDTVEHDVSLGTAAPGFIPTRHLRAYHLSPSIAFPYYYALAAQPSAPAPVSAPLRKLPWGQLNFLHTTDTHGWHGGHLQEAQYSADWGDYISFAHHLHKRADDDGSDLLIIDTGDRVEGNGLYDASNPKGKYTSDIIAQQKIDILTVGNHELYQANTSRREYEKVVPNFKDSYIASNLDIVNEKTGKPEPLAPRYRKFVTKNQGIRILAFGFLFNFRGNANNSVVQRVQDTVKEQWFQDAIREKDVDLIIVAGHVPVRDSEEFELIYKTIRGENWNTPIAFFGGHTHIRDYRKFEKKVWALESGRYMETLGFLSISGLGTGKKDTPLEQASVEFNRLYIDNNLYSLHHHSGTNASTFDTGLGHNVSQAIRSARSTLDLDKTFGCAPQDYWLSRAPYPSNESMISWLENEVLPDSFETLRAPSIVITNTGAMRFDIFKGPFTIDTTFLVSPFTSGFNVLKDVPYQAASQVLQLLNNDGPIALVDLIAVASDDSAVDVQYTLPDLTVHTPQRTSDARRTDHDHEKVVQELGGQQVALIARSKDDHDQPLTPGYTTIDDAGDSGDDTVHAPIQFYNVPNAIASNVGFDPADVETVDIVYNQFIQDWVILALKYLGVEKTREDSSVALKGKTLTEILSTWVAEHWKCDDKEDLW
nr:secreted protein [Quercus suber]